jgi:hypothetical protein
MLSIKCHLVETMKLPPHATQGTFQPINTGGATFGYEWLHLTSGRSRFAAEENLCAIQSIDLNIS